MPNKLIQRKCNSHGLTDFVLEGSGYYRCKKCRSSNVIKRRAKAIMLVREYKGGSCEICGYNKCMPALEFHHKDPTTKEFSICSDGSTRSLDRMKKEADKCHLLCANCHREVHSGLHSNYIV